MTERDGAAVRQQMTLLIEEALPAGEPRPRLGDGDELASVGITSMVLLQVFSRFIEEFQVDPSLLGEVGELRNVGQLLSLGERLAGLP